MPLMKYFRSLRGRYRRSAPAGQNEAGKPSDCAEPAGPRTGSDDMLAAQRFYAEQETTRTIGRKQRGKGLRKHITGIFTI